MEDMTENLESQFFFSRYKSIIYDVLFYGGLKDGICHYRATDDELYENPMPNIIDWMTTYADYDIQFENSSGNASQEDLTGTYVRDDNTATIVIEKNSENQYEITGQASWATNTGNIEGELAAINSQQYSYVTGEEPYEAELKILAYEEHLYVQMWTSRSF